MSTRCVLDSNVLVAGLRSSRGASHRVLQLILAGSVRPILSVPLVLEYEAVLKRESVVVGLSAREAGAVVDDLCSVGEHHAIFFLWRPTMRDPSDDFLLELAFAASCPWIVTHNLRDFGGAGRFGVTCTTPRDFLLRIGEKP